MPIYLGANKIKDLFLGTSKIKEIWLGTSKIYSSEIPFPQGYTRHYFLQNASAGQYNVPIDDLTLNTSFKTVVNINFETRTGTRQFWGHSTVGGARAVFNGNSNVISLGTAATQISCSPNVHHDITLDRMLGTTNTLTMWLDGDTSSAVSIACSTNVNALKLFTNNSNAYTGRERIYSVKVYDENGTLIRDLVPAEDDNDVVGGKKSTGFVNLCYPTYGLQFYDSSNRSSITVGDESDDTSW